RHFVTEIRTGTELVRRGVYGRIRHPSETGLLMAMTGSTLLLSSTAAFGVVTFVLLPIVVVRTREEDAALAGAFGAAHERYRRAAGRFLPRLVSFVGVGSSSCREDTCPPSFIAPPAHSWRCRQAPLASFLLHQPPSGERPSGAAKGDPCDDR